VEVSFNGNLLTFRLESEDDLLEVASFLQKRRKPIEAPRPVRIKPQIQGRIAKRDHDTFEAILRRIRSKGNFRESEISDVVMKEMGIKSDTTVETT
jgi:hypothetical protein